jgi:hypothetical protein
MKQLTGMTLIILSSLVCCAGIGIASQDSFEINLKELQPAKAQHRTRHRAAVPEKQMPPEAGQANGNSIYTIRPGDHLFLILIRNYGLTNDAAERLIPEVMRQNNIRNPHGLIVGQRLTIPLPPKQEQPAKTVRKGNPPTTAATTKAEMPQFPPSQAIQNISEIAQRRQGQKAPEAVEGQVTITAAPPCSLARDFANKLKVIAPQSKLIQGKDTLTAEHAGLTVVIACGLSLEEAYTYGRLLAQHNVQLIDFTGNEPNRRVIEKLANSLGLSYRLADPDAGNNLPFGYIFSAIGPNGQDIRLTIVPADH